MCVRRTYTLACVRRGAPYANQPVTKITRQKNDVANENLCSQLKSIVFDVCDVIVVELLETAGASVRCRGGAARRRCRLQNNVYDKSLLLSIFTFYYTIPNYINTISLLLCNTLLKM